MATRLPACPALEDMRPRFVPPWPRREYCYDSVEVSNDLTQHAAHGILCALRASDEILTAIRQPLAVRWQFGELKLATEKTRRDAGRNGLGMRIFAEEPRERPISVTAPSPGRNECASRPARSLDLGRIRASRVGRGCCRARAARSANHRYPRRARGKQGSELWCAS
jgi:hypothetical protein